MVDGKGEMHDGISVPRKYETAETEGVRARASDKNNNSRTVRRWAPLSLSLSLSLLLSRFPSSTLQTVLCTHDNVNTARHVERSAHRM